MIIEQNRDQIRQMKNHYERTHIKEVMSPLFVAVKKSCKIRKIKILEFRMLLLDCIVKHLQK